MSMVSCLGRMPKYKERVTLPFQIKFRVNYLFIWTACVLACREDNLAIWIRVRRVQSFGTAVGGKEGWVAPQGKDRGHRAAWVFEGWVFILVLPQTLGMTVGKSQST